MLKKNNRLKSNRAFRATYKNNNIVKDEFIVLYAGRLKEDENYPTRVGFVVSKKVHKRAVIRNRIKRLMRESLRLMFKYNNTDIINKYQSLIFCAQQGVQEKNKDEINTLILTLLNKLAKKNIQ